jgi:hypothetical protein
MTSIPSFDASDVELLRGAVEKVLQQLRDANERVGGNDAELIETGRQYALLLQKLQAVNASST